MCSRERQQLQQRHLGTGQKCRCSGSTPASAAPRLSPPSGGAGCGVRVQLESNLALDLASLQAALLRVWSRQHRPGRPGPVRNAEPQAHGPAAGRGVDTHGDVRARGSRGGPAFGGFPRLLWDVLSAPSWLTPLTLLAHSHLPQPHAHLSRRTPGALMHLAPLLPASTEGRRAGSGPRDLCLPP